MRRILSILMAGVVIVVGATSGVASTVAVALLHEPRNLSYGEFLVDHTRETAERRIIRFLRDQYDNTRYYHTKQQEKRAPPPELPLLCSRGKRGCA